MAITLDELWAACEGEEPKGLLADARNAKTPEACMKAAESSISSSKGDRSEAAGLIVLAEALAQKKEFQQAIDKLKEALALTQKMEDKKAEAIVLSGMCSTQAANDEPFDALNYAKQVLTLFKDMNDKSGQIFAFNLYANALLGMHKAKDALRAAKDALLFCRDVGSKKREVPVLLTLVHAFLSKSDYEEALRAAKEAVRIQRSEKNPKGEAEALDTVAGVYLASGDASLAYKCAEESLGLAREIKDKWLEVSALQRVVSTLSALAKPASALETAKLMVDIVKKETSVFPKKYVAGANLTLATSHPASSEAMDAAKEAASLYKELGYRKEEASSLQALAACYLYGVNKNTDEAIKTAKSALSIYKEKDDKSGQSLVVHTLASAYIAKGDTKEGERLARDSLGFARDAGDKALEAEAMRTVTMAQTTTIQATNAGIRVDGDIVHIDVSDMATQESLETLVTELSHVCSNRSVGCLALHIEGRSGPVPVQDNDVKTGVFIMGLRTLGLPMVCSCNGKIAGPTWALVICSDYRITASSATFLTPIWGAPEEMPDLIGHSVALRLLTNTGPMNALDMLNVGIIHQLQKGRDDAKKAAAEMARRISSLPKAAMANECYKSGLMSTAAQKYAIAAAKGMLRA